MATTNSSYGELGISSHSRSTDLAGEPPFTAHPVHSHTDSIPDTTKHLRVPHLRGVPRCGFFLPLASLALHLPHFVAVAARQAR
jgi:hypothetical protein